MNFLRRQAVWICLGVALSLAVAGCGGGEKQYDPSDPKVAQATPWIANLKLSDPVKRRQAISALAKIDHECVIEPLTDSATYDNQVELRAMAARALARPALIKNPKPIIDLLSSNEPEVRLAICETLAVLKPPSAEEALARQVSDPVTPVRLAAVKALSQLGPSGLARLDKAFAEGTVSERAAIIDAFGRSGDKARVPALIASLAAEEDAIRRAAAEALGMLRDDSAVPALVALAREPLSPARISAEHDRLARGATNADADAIVRMLDAARARGGDAPGGWRAHSHIYKEVDKKREPKNGIDKQAAAGHFRMLIEQQLRDAGQAIRVAAVDAMRNIGSKPAIDAVVELLAVTRDQLLEKVPATQRTAGVLRDADQDVEDITGAAIKALSGGDIGKDQLYAVLKDSSSPSVARIRAITILVRDNRAIHESKGDTLVSALDKLKRGEKVGHAIRSKWVKPPPDVSPLADQLRQTLESLLTDANVQVRVQAARILASRKIDKALEPLIASLDNDDPEVRAAVVEGLANFRDPRPVPKLLAMLRTPALAEFAPSIINTLGAIGQSSAVPELVKMLKIDHPHVLAVVKAVGAIGDPGAGPELMKLFTSVNAELAATQPSRRPPDDARRLSGIRSAAIAAIGQVKYTAAVPMLTGLMKNLDPRRPGDEEILEALGNIGDKSAVQPIVDRLSKPPYNVHSRTSTNRTTLAGIHALAKLNDARAVPLLAKWTTCPPAPDKYTVDYAFDGLGAIACPESADALTKLLVDPNVDAAVKDGSIGPALVQLGIVAKPQMMKLMLEAPPQKDVTATDTGIYAAQILGLMGKQIVPELANVAKTSKQKHVLGRAIQALQGIEEDEAVEAIGAILKNTANDGEVRQWAAIALGKMKRKSAGPILQAAKNDADPNISEWSKWALKQIGLEQ